MAGPTCRIDTRRHGGTAIVSYANPPDGLIANKGAALLAEAIAPLLADADVRAIVLTGGQPGVFIRHADVAQIVRAADALAAGTAGPEAFVDAPFPRLCALIEGADKPVIAAIDGLCMGGGFEIALCCTLRIAGAGATAIGLPEIRLGIFPGSGGTQRLPRLIGAHRARRFILDGTVVDAGRALALGLVDEAVPDALTRALEIAEGYARRPAGAIAAILRLTRAAVPPTEMADALAAFATLLRDDPAAVAGMRAWLADPCSLDEWP